MTISPILFISTLLMLSSPTWAIDIKVSDSRANNVYMDALTWVLDKSGADYRLVHTDHSMSSQVRKVTLVQSGELDIMYAGTTRELEEQLLPIRFPITRGLIGKRVFIINKNYKSDYGQIKSLEDLKLYSGILGFKWADKEVLEAVGLQQTEEIYDDIFVSLNSGSRYYFPRGILEAYSELIDKENILSNLVVEDNVLLEYKSAVLFFINPKNKELEAILNEGFKKGYADGSYKNFLYKHPLIKGSFDKAKLGQRVVVAIPNPFFPEKSLMIPSKYWHE